MISALVVGGGSVATRKATALLNAGARVHVVAPEVLPELDALAGERSELRITRGQYAAVYLRGTTLVVAATDDATVNADIARDARDRGMLVNVADAPDLGNCVTPAVHRSGEVTVAVSAGRVPAAAARIRDSIGASIDGRYAVAVRELASLRRSLIDAGNRERWRQASAALVGENFCDQVESGDFASRVAKWR